MFSVSCRLVVGQSVGMECGLELSDCIVDGVLENYAVKFYLY